VCLSLAEREGEGEEKERGERERERRKKMLKKLMKKIEDNFAPALVAQKAQ
jgi:hypothetical protein